MGIVQAKSTRLIDQACQHFKVCTSTYVLSEVQHRDRCWPVFNETLLIIPNHGLKFKRKLFSTIPSYRTCTRRSISIFQDSKGFQRTTLLLFFCLGLSQNRRKWRTGDFSLSHFRVSAVLPFIGIRICLPIYFYLTSSQCLERSKPRTNTKLVDRG